MEILEAMGQAQGRPRHRSGLKGSLILSLDKVFARRYHYDFAFSSVDLVQGLGTSSHPLRAVRLLEIANEFHCVPACGKIDNDGERLK